MAGRARVFAGMLIRRAIAAERRAAFLACPQVDPRGANLHAFLALAVLWLFDRGDRVDMRTASVRHYQFLSFTWLRRIHYATRPRRARLFPRRNVSSQARGWSGRRRAPRRR